MVKKFSSVYGSGNYVSANNLVLTAIGVILHVYFSVKFCHLQEFTSRQTVLFRMFLVTFSLMPS